MTSPLGEVAQGGGTAPSGRFARALFRLPILLYRARLGWLLGHRFLLLEHTGRTSGKLRRTVLEVVEEQARGYVVVSGFGRRSGWYRNLRSQPNAAIVVGRRRLSVLAEALPPDAGAELMAAYAQQHPRACRELTRFMGFRWDGTQAGIRELGRKLPFVLLWRDPRAAAEAQLTEAYLSQ